MKTIMIAAVAKACLLSTGSAQGDVTGPAFRPIMEAEAQERIRRPVLDRGDANRVSTRLVHDMIPLGAGRLAEVSVDQGFLYRGVPATVRVRIYDFSGREDVVLRSVNVVDGKLNAPFAGQVIELTPEARTVELGLSYEDPDGNSVAANVSLPVRAVPAPGYRVMVNGKEAALGAVISKRSRIAVEVVPDRLFAQQYGELASAEMDEVTLLSQRSLGAPTVAGRFRGDNISLGNSLKSDPPGTTIYLRGRAGGVYSVSGDEVFAAFVVK